MGTADDSILAGNLIVRAAKGVSLASGVVGASIRHNTVVVDVNGSTTGLFDGAAPDIGYDEAD